MRLLLRLSALTNLKPGKFNLRSLSEKKIQSMFQRDIVMLYDLLFWDLILSSISRRIVRIIKMSNIKHSSKPSPPHLHKGREVDFSKLKIENWEFFKTENFCKKSRRSKVKWGLSRNRELSYYIEVYMESPVDAA